jgi:CheY-like chemotaxis protein
MAQTFIMDRCKNLKNGDLAIRSVVCFIDDDPEEAKIFERAWEDHYMICGDVALEGAMHKLSLQSHKPRLFILDLCFPCGRESSNEECRMMIRLNGEVDAAQRKLSNYLKSIGQDRSGGIELMSRIRERYADVSVIFHTRKGILEGAEFYLRAGAQAVIRKHFPERLDDEKDLYEQLALAAKEQKERLQSLFDERLASRNLIEKLGRIYRYIKDNWRRL